ncbi:MAG: hypothetical protein ACRDY2_10780 [Acidimicrobiales bacterium]
MPDGTSGSASELSSLASALEDLTKRVAGIAEGYGRAGRDDLAAELYAAERALAGARRRLSAVIEADR